MKACLTLLLLALTAALTHAGDIPTWPMPPMDYFLERMPTPPATGSAMDQADLDYILVVQAAATPEQIAHAQKSVAFDVFTFSEVLGPNFTVAHYPQTAAFFKRLEVTSNDVKNPIKDHYARLRPYEAHKDLVKILVTREPNFSFPSGHATRSWLYALVLGQLDPANRLPFLHCASQVGADRIIGGMHYQTDVLAAHALAQLIFDALQKDPTFLQDLNTLRAAEWKSPPAK
ncbi:phosphatase PAP2 family protein [soil metagenome]